MKKRKRSESRSRSRDRSDSRSKPRSKSKSKKKRTHRKEHKRRRSSRTSSSSSSTSSSSSSSSSSRERKRKEKKKKRKKMKKKKKKKKRDSIDETKKKIQGSVPQQNDIGPVLPSGVKPGPSKQDDEQSKSRSMRPMTKEEWEKSQSVIRHVYDPETGRNRLIKGDGEVLEEIVSKQRQKEINKQATKGDGLFFATKMGIQDR